MPNKTKAAKKRLLRADLDALIEYTLAHEVDDFSSMLDNGELAPLPGVDQATWDSHFALYTKAASSADPVLNATADKLFEWLAANTEGHVYACAYRINRTKPRY